MSYQNTIIDESMRCMDDECPQRAVCRRWTTREEVGGHVYAGSLRPRWMPQDGDCIYRLPVTDTQEAEKTDE